MLLSIKSNSYQRSQIYLLPNPAEAQLQTGGFQLPPQPPPPHDFLKNNEKYQHIMDTSLSDLSISPFQELMREASKKSELVHRNHDLTDPPYFKDGDPVSHEPLFPTTLCHVCQSLYFLPTSELSEDEVKMARLGYPDQTDWAFNRLLFYFHQPSLEALYKSSEGGCHCCTLIWRNCFAEQDFSPSHMTASDPIILDHSLGMKELAWHPDWFPGNGNYMGIQHAGKAYGWVQLRFLQIPR
jgi:hypothetical protein